MGSITPVFVSPTDRPTIVVAGPCSAESESQVLATAELLAGKVDMFRAGLWKPRTKPGNFEGVGEAGLLWLAKVAEIFKVPVTTEVATERHVKLALDAGLDTLWIGARTTANPFAVQEISEAINRFGNCDVKVLLKNPVNPDVELWDGAIQRLLAAGVSRITAVHRGFTPVADNVYRNSPLWSIANSLRLRYPELQMLCDPSHIGGRRDLIAPLSQTALDLGFDGLMIETHCEPSAAWSDKNQQLSPAELFDMLDQLKFRDKTMRPSQLDSLRDRIDSIDMEILDALRRRMEVSSEIGQLKRKCRMPVVQPERFNEMMDGRLAEGLRMGLSEKLLREIFLSIHTESVARQLQFM